MTERCGNCRFIYRGPAGDLFCRRYPPQMVATISYAKPDRRLLKGDSEAFDITSSVQPYVTETLKDYWCGEYQPA